MWLGLIRSDGLRYRRLAKAQQLSSSEAAGNDFVAEGGEWSHQFGVKGPITITACWPDADARLELSRFYPPTALFPSTAATIAEQTAPDHFETAGWARGSVRIGDEWIEIDALCVRDHGWGYRDWNRNLNHRWLAGSFGPGLSFHSLVYHARDGSLLRTGYVVRDGNVVRAEHVDVLVFMEPDGLTNRGASIRWDLEDGTNLMLECQVIDALVFEHHEKHSVQTLCRVEHNGAVGFCNLETTTNPTDGRGRATLVLNACNKDGISLR